MEDKTMKVIWAGLLTAVLVALSVSYVRATSEVFVCHRTRSVSNPFRLLSLPEATVATHLGHGDLYAGTVDSEPLFGWSCELAS